ncbi:MAG: AroM family protein [bacterium]|nr:AroM family protein [bacterium]
MKHRIGAITIGQSPRTDVIPEIQQLIEFDIEFVEIGALDGLTLDEVETLAPKTGDYVLHTRMKDGSAVTIGKEAILPRMQACVDTLTQQGVEFIALLCTGKFPEFDSPVLLLEPQKITDTLITALAGTQHKIGIITPLAEQVEQAAAQLQGMRENIVAVHASPYTPAFQDELARAASILREKNIRLSVLHCIGYTLEMKKQIKELTEKPVILARSLTAQILRELLL